MSETSSISPTAPYKLIAVDSIDSTNILARMEAARGCDDFTLIWAKHQTAGRGTRGRTWISPRGNLFWSLVLRPNGDWAHVETLSYTAAVAVGELLLSYGNIDGSLRYKWPNDVLVNGKKISGILLEASAQSGGKSLNDGPERTAAHDWLVIGVGINNVAHPPAEATRYPATSLTEVFGSSVPIERLMVDYCDSFLTWFRRWREGGFTSIRDRIMQRLMGVDTDIQVKIGETTVTGRFVDITGDGAAWFRSNAGELICVRSGEVLYNGHVNES